MGPLRLYEVFHAMKLHWTTEGYDFKKFKGKVKNLNRFTLEKSSDRAIYFALSKKYPIEKDFALTLIPLFLENPNLHISALYNTEETKKKSLAWYRKMQTMPTWFASDCEFIAGFIAESGMTYHQYFLGTAILYHMLYDSINIETFIILDRMLSFLTRNKKDIIIYRQMYDLKVRKYSEFIQVDKERYRNIFEKAVKNNKRKRRPKCNSPAKPGYLDDIPF